MIDYPESIAGLSRDGLTELLGIKPAQFSRYLENLQEILGGCPDWKYKPYSRGFNEFEISAFIAYRDLAKQFGLKFANQNIRKQIGVEHHDSTQNRQQQQNERGTGRATARQSERQSDIAERISELLY